MWKTWWENGISVSFLPAVSPVERTFHWTFKSRLPSSYRDLFAKPVSIALCHTFPPFCNIYTFVLEFLVFAHVHFFNAQNSKCAKKKKNRCIETHKVSFLILPLGVARVGNLRNLCTLVSLKWISEYSHQPWQFTTLQQTQWWKIALESIPQTLSASDKKLLGCWLQLIVDTKSTL